jgi:hypothetical protein
MKKTHRVGALGATASTTDLGCAVAGALDSALAAAHWRRCQARIAQRAKDFVHPSINLKSEPVLTLLIRKAVIVLPR